MDFVEIVNQYGMPIAMAGGMGYFIYLHMEICDDTNQTKTWCNIRSVGGTDR